MVTRASSSASSLSSSSSSAIVSSTASSSSSSTALSFPNALPRAWIRYLVDGVDFYAYLQDDGLAPGDPRISSAITFDADSDEKSEIFESPVVPQTPEQDAIEEPRSFTFNDRWNEDFCCVCFNEDAEEDNPILLCDGCNCAVHQWCYGVIEIPSGDWFCDRCLIRRGKQSLPSVPLNFMEKLKANVDAGCILCPHTQGAMKPTEDGRWAHAACAFWIPELGFKNETNFDYIVGINEIDKRRFKLTCELCQLRYGAAIQCQWGHCHFSFHSICGWLGGLRLELEMIQTKDSYDVNKIIRCAKHRRSKGEQRAFIKAREQRKMEDEKKKSEKSTPKPKRKKKKRKNSDESDDDDDDDSSDGLSSSWEDSDDEAAVIAVMESVKDAEGSARKRTDRANRSDSERKESASESAAATPKKRRSKAMSAEEKSRRKEERTQKRAAERKKRLEEKEKEEIEKEKLLPELERRKAERRRLRKLEKRILKEAEETLGLSPSSSPSKKASSPNMHASALPASVAVAANVVLATDVLRLNAGVSDSLSASRAQLAPWEAKLAEANKSLPATKMMDLSEALLLPGLSKSSKKQKLTHYSDGMGRMSEEALLDEDGKKEKEKAKDDVDKKKELKKPVPKIIVSASRPSGVLKPKMLPGLPSRPPVNPNLSLSSSSSSSSSATLSSSMPNTSANSNASAQRIGLPQKRLIASPPSSSTSSSASPSAFASSPASSSSSSLPAVTSLPGVRPFAYANASQSVPAFSAPSLLYLSESELRDRLYSLTHSGDTQLCMDVLTDNIIRPQNVSVLQPFIERFVSVGGALLCKNWLVFGQENGNRNVVLTTLLALQRMEELITIDFNGKLRADLMSVVESLQNRHSDGTVRKIAQDVLTNMRQRNEQMEEKERERERERQRLRQKQMQMQAQVVQPTTTSNEFPRSASPQPPTQYEMDARPASPPPPSYLDTPTMSMTNSNSNINPPLPTTQHSYPPQAVQMPMQMPMQMQMQMPLSNMSSSMQTLQNPASYMTANSGAAYAPSAFSSMIASLQGLGQMWQSSSPPIQHMQSYGFQQQQQQPQLQQLQQFQQPFLPSFQSNPQPQPYLQQFQALQQSSHPHTSANVTSGAGIGGHAAAPTVGAAGTGGGTAAGGSGSLSFLNNLSMLRNLAADLQKHLNSSKPDPLT